jgi:protein-L-isoaspartate(D-aspartate) O-methyltransferase
MNSGYKDYHFNERRRQLVAALKNRRELDPQVLDAMLELPRELFISPALSGRAYEDNALPIDCNQTISQPYTVAYMTSLLKVKNGDKILEIGTGSGYQASLLYLLGAKVFTIERISLLLEKATKAFAAAGFSITTRLGDGTLGWRDFAPFDGIIVTAAAPDVPKPLLEQLAIRGRLVLPIGDKSVQTMYLIEKIDEQNFSRQTTDRFKFVPLIGKEGWQQNDS